MHVVIGGFGRVGRSLAHALEAEGHTVSVVDHDPRVFDEFAEEIRGRKIVGEIFDRDSLVKAGIERADTFAAVSSGDNSNIVAARVAREHFGVKTVVARIFDPKRADIYGKFGIPTVSSVRWTSARLLGMILQPGAQVEQAFGGGDIALVEVEIGSACAGKSVGELENAKQVRIAAVERDHRAEIPSQDTVVQLGDVVHVAIARSGIAGIECFMQAEEE
jgi:trk system potassium uptake protein TrkA